jgi:uncharacterized pyridoxamine 5'-phosphate oxidase family protein
MMRISGKGEFRQDTSLETRLFKDRQWLKDFMKTAPDNARVAIFRIAHTEAYFWTMENNMREQEAPHLEF